MDIMSVIKYWDYLDNLDWFIFVSFLVLIVLWYYKYIHYITLGIRKYKKHQVILLLCAFLSIVFSWVLGFSYNINNVYWNHVIWNVWHIRIQTAGFVIIVVGSFNIYRQYGGMHCKDIILYVCTFIKCLFKLDFSLLKDEKYKLFLQSRVPMVIVRYKNVDSAVNIALKLIDMVTDRLKSYVNKQRDWGVFNSKDIEEFLIEVSDITDNQYSLIDHLGFSEQYLSSFNNVKNSMTPNFNARLREILEDNTFTDFQRKDSILKSLAVFGVELKEEIVNIHNVIKEHKKLTNGNGKH